LYGIRVGVVGVGVAGIEDEDKLEVTAADEVAGV
jgi:hypothetical protein